MTWGVLNVAMLAGLAGVAIPIVVHLLSRRRDPVIEWGAMQFLDLGPKSRRRIDPADLLLMLARMSILGLVALAAARPFWRPSASSNGSGAIGRSGTRRDVVLVIDGSAGMGRRVGDSTPRNRAIAWAKSYVAGLAPGDSAAVLIANDRVRPLVDPPSFDHAKVVRAIGDAPPARGSSDLSAAVADAFRVLERTSNPIRDIIILTDHQRSAWRPDQPARWALLRDLQKRMPIGPRLWALDFASTTDGSPMASDPPNASIDGLELSRTLLTPGLAVTVTATVANSGPGPISRSIELLIDGRPASETGSVVGPIPPGGKVPATFRIAFDEPGGHLLTARLGPADDPLPSDDERSRPVEVSTALPVLLVDGEPGTGTLDGETDFLRAALVPGGDDAPQVKATVINENAFTPASVADRKVIVLANMRRLTAESISALDAFVASGGGLAIVVGDRTEVDFAPGAGWPAAAIGETKGDPARRQTVAHPAPRTFVGPALGPLGQGDAPPLSEADLFSYRLLKPRDGSTVLARLDSGDPWIVERPHGRGRVVMIGSTLDAEGGTLPVNPDFVPFVHELILRLGAGSIASPNVRPGEPIVFDLARATVPPRTTLPLLTPDGTTVRLAASTVNGSTRATVTDTIEPGIYRLTKPNPPGGFSYAQVSSDPSEADAAVLSAADASMLAQGWPLVFEPDPAALPSRLASVGSSPPREFWRGLIFAAIGGLCVEVWLTRRAAKARGAM